MQALRPPPPTVSLGGRAWPLFRLLGLAGLGASTAVSIGAAEAIGLSGTFQAAIVAVAVLVFLALAMATKVVLDREALVYYHHELAILGATALLCAAADRPVLAHLDVTVAGLGVFLAFGRIGCLAAGCCHGRPAGSGIVYGSEHLRAGFPAYLEGRPLVPVQLAEAALAGALACGCLALLGGAPGDAFGLYVTGYAIARFALEHLRGDAIRPYWRGVSEAQWTSLLVVAGAAALAATGELPGAPEHVAACALLVAWTLWDVAHGDAADRWRPLDARQVTALERHLDALLRQSPGPARVYDVGAGIRLSAGRTDDVLHVTLSRAGHALSPADAGSLATLIAQCRGARDVEYVAGVAGTFHVLLRQPQSSLRSP